MAERQHDEPLGVTGHHPLHATLEQGRSVPPVRLSIPVQVGLSGGNIACARIYNLSSEGIQIRCDPGTARRIHPAGKAISDRSGPEVLIALRLKHGADIRTQVLRCRVFYVLPESPQEVIIGLEFEELNQAQREVIDALMGARLEFLE